jgi:hypothetical protein
MGSKVSYCRLCWKISIKTTKITAIFTSISYHSVFTRPPFLFFQHNQQCDTLLPIVPCTHKLKAGIAYRKCPWNQAWIRPHTMPRTREQRKTFKMNMQQNTDSPPPPGRPSLSRIQSRKFSVTSFLWQGLIWQVLSSKYMRLAFEQAHVAKYQFWSSVCVNKENLATIYMRLVSRSIVVIVLYYCYRAGQKTKNLS